MTYKYIAIFLFFCFIGIGFPQELKIIDMEGTYDLDGDEHLTLCGLKPSLKSSKELVERYLHAKGITETEDEIYVESVASEVVEQDRVSNPESSDNQTTLF